MAVHREARRRRSIGLRGSVAQRNCGEEQTKAKEWLRKERQCKGEEQAIEALQRQIVGMKRRSEEVVCKGRAKVG